MNIIFFDESELTKYYNKWLYDCELWASVRDNNHAKESMGIMKESIMYGIYDSMESESIYFDGSILPTYQGVQSPVDITAEDVSQIMNIDLSPELYHLPIPSTLSEAIILRSRPEIVSFRNVFFEWCKAIKQGDIDMATRIKKDISIAQKELDKYYKWETRKTKLFSCITEVLIGQIPYLSNVVGAISPFQTRDTLRKKSKNSWILLLK